ncbi:MAG: glycerol-3-phosphate responsive antiterminator [Pleomorphochaeta sp.]
MDLIKKGMIIPSIKNNEGLSEVLISEHEVVFLLYGDLLNIEEIITKLKNKGKTVFVNVDLLVGFSSKDIVIKYLYQKLNIDGIISSKSALILEAKKYGLITIHKFFLIDSFSYKNMYAQLKKSKPDMLEIVPGWDRIIEWTNRHVDIPIIAGGLVCKKDMIRNAFKSGATAIATTNSSIWDVKLDAPIKKQRVLRVKKIPSKS